MVADTFHDVLWVIGVFEGADGIQSPYAVGYTGSNWIPFPGTFNANRLTGVNCAMMYNGNLVLGKTDKVDMFSFTSHQWTTIANTSDEVLCLGVFNGDLIAGGRFWFLDGNEVNHISKWNGTQWDTLGGGLTGSVYIVECLKVYHNKLYTGGNFDYAGGVEAWNIAAWNDTTWNNLCSSGGSFGTDELSGNHDAASVMAMEVFNDKLYITGQFEKVCGSNCYLAYWDDTTWHSTSYPYGDGRKLSSSNGKLVVKSLGIPFPYYYIYYWDGVNAPAVDSAFSGGAAIDLALFQNTLYAGGGFDFSGNTAAFRIARLVDVGNGIKEIENEYSVAVYPNPVGEQLTINNGELTITEIRITDISGRELLIRNSNIKNQKEVIIDVKELPAGFYIIKVNDRNGGVTVGRFVKQ
ncbi:MAG: T9SS type A sorting domain-containing protein [Bacteroidota bacterium]